MNSYAASCCTCFPKVLCGSATSASWPTASVPPACRSAFSCSLPPNNRKPDKALPSIRTHAILGLAPSVVARWCSSSGLRLPKSNFALHPRSRLQHETTPANPKTPCASARSVSPWLAAEHTLSSRSTNCTLRRTVSTQSSFNRTRLSVALRGTASTHPHTRSFPLLNPHKARVRRNHGRLPSSRCIESAQSHRARGRILPTRASDTALRLFGSLRFRGPLREQLSSGDHSSIITLIRRSCICALNRCNNKTIIDVESSPAIGYGKPVANQAEHR